MNNELISALYIGNTGVEEIRVGGVILWHNHKNAVDMKTTVEAIPNMDYYVIKANNEQDADAVVSATKIAFDRTGKYDKLVVLQNGNKKYSIVTFVWDAQTKSYSFDMQLDLVDFHQLPIWVKVKDKDGNVMKTLVKFRENI